MRRNLLHSRQIVVVCIITLLAACRITRPFQLPPDVVNNDLYRDIRNSDTNTIATIPWQQFFTDTILQALLQEGIDNNPDIDIAVARIEQAAATYRQSRLAYFPTLNATTSATQQKVPATRFGASEVYDVYLSTSWEIDIWGKFRSTQRANRALLLQSEAFRRAVQTQLVADIATAYLPCSLTTANCRSPSKP